MRPETRSAIQDILTSAVEVEDLAGDNAENYLNKRVEALAIERLFLNIGEALLRVRRSDTRVAERITMSREIIGFRSVLVHGYDHVDPRRVAEVITD